MNNNKSQNYLEEAENRREWVDARSLHSSLGIGRHFSAWIRGRIEKHGFVYGEDYEVILKPPENRRGRMWKEYFLSPETSEKLTAIEQGRRTLNDQVTPFDFGSRKLRVINRKGELWFLGNDACRILGINRPHAAVDELEEEARMTIYVNLGNSKWPINYQIVSEYGLHLLFFRSKRPGAKEASKWLVNVAMPQIRQAFAKPSAPPSLMGRIRLFIKSLAQPYTDRPGKIIAKIVKKARHFADSFGIKLPTL
jgi:phage anti-repressor protein